MPSERSLGTIMPNRGQIIFWVVVLALILVPFALFGEAIERAAGDWVSQPSSPWLRGAGISILLALDTFLPIPSSLVATAAGAILGFVNGTVAVWLGLVVANSLGYLCGTKWGRPMMQKISQENVSENAPKSPITMAGLLLTRGVPVLSETMVIAAGVAGMPFSMFLAIIVPANLGLAAVYAWFGSKAVSEQSFLLVFAASVTIPLAGYALYKAFKFITKT